MTSDEVRRSLIDIGQGKIVAQKVIEQLRPFVEELQTSGSIMLKRKLDQHALLINKIFNEIIETGNAKQQDVIELKVVLKDLKDIYNDLKNYHDATENLKGGSKT